MTEERYRRSAELLRRAQKTIPLGSQTFSKSITQFPLGISPHFIERGQGSRVWDVDGNEYIDFVSALAAVTLGYNDPDVDAAVRSQLDSGVTFSLAHPLEMQVAERIVDMVPCAEMVRFGKNGSDATSGAVRLARAYTGRDHIAVCGYHGWQDWYIGSTSRNLGVPQATRDLTHTFTYNDLESLQRIFDEFPNAVAAVILEPMNVQEPAEGFLEGVVELAHANDALVVFDEVITGFRFARGGAQEYFGVTPDLTTLGKGLANGYPLSAVCGRAEIMKLMEEVFFSFTFGGETLSLAAANAVLRKVAEEPIVETLAARGERLVNSLGELIARHDLADVFRVSGHPSWSFLNMEASALYTPFELKTFLLQELFARGILMIGTHNLTYAHSEEDISSTLEVYDEVLGAVRGAIDNESLKADLRCKPLEPLFSVR